VPCHVVAAKDKPSRTIYHMDLGFDPKNEVVRVDAYLGEQRTPIKQWLSACLWHNLTYSRLEPAYPAGLVRHKELLEHAAGLGLSVREWMDSAVGNDSGSISRI